MNLGQVLRAWRLHEEIKVRDAAKTMGLSPATYNRIERGESMDGDSLAKILKWLTGEKS